MRSNACTSFLLCLVTAAAAVPLRAQQEIQPESPAQPPAVVQGGAQPAGQASTLGAAAPAPAPRRIARLAFLAGALQVQRSDNTGEDAAVLNMPLPEGTRLITGDQGEAEIEFEDGSVARLTPHSALSIDALELDAKSVASTQLALLSGLAYLELRSTPTANFQVDAGGISAQPTANTVLRISLDQGVPTFTALAGSLSITNPAGLNATVKAGESLRPNPEDPTGYLLNQELADDTWDSWNQSRDQAAVGDAGSRTLARDGFAGPQGYGWSDLDANGNWYNVPGADSANGAAGSTTEVWQPSDAATDSSDYADDGFDPYGDGAFVWSGGGYLWASSYSWGWIPYRCGRWSWYPGFGWGWSPDRFCRVFGFGPGGPIHVGPHPQRYRVLHPPLRGPGPVHPIHRVRSARGSDPASRPAPARSGDIRIAGVLASPLPRLGPIGSSYRSPVGQALYRDYPVESGSHTALLGAAPEPVDTVGYTPPLTGWVTRQSGEYVPPASGSPGIIRPSSTPTPFRSPAPPVEHHAPPPPPPHSPPPPPPAPASSKPK